MHRYIISTLLALYATPIKQNQLLGDQTIDDITGLWTKDFIESDEKNVVLNHHHQIQNDPRKYLQDDPQDLPDYPWAPLDQQSEGTETNIFMK